MDFSFRQYDPQIGRFLSVDPLAAGTDMLSSFAAMNNQPESVIDPLGLQGFYAGYAGFTNRIDDPSGFGAGRMRRPYNGPGPEREAMLAGSIAGTGYGWYVLEMAAKREREEGLKAMRQRELTLMGMRDVYAANLAGNFSPEHSWAWYDGNSTRNPDKPEGTMTLSQANKWAHIGNGEGVNIDFTKIILPSSVTAERFNNPDFEEDGNPGIYVKFDFPSDFVNPNQGLVYGSIKVVLIDENTVWAMPDVYDFDQKKGSNNFGRNLATAIGAFVRDFGWLNSPKARSFPIYFYGYQQIPKK